MEESDLFLFFFDGNVHPLPNVVFFKLYKSLLLTHEKDLVTLLCIHL